MAKLSRKLDRFELGQAQAAIAELVDAEYHITEARSRREAARETLAPFLAK